jgi:hypothetical protein
VCAWRNDLECVSDEGPSNRRGVVLRERKLRNAQHIQASPRSGLNEIRKRQLLQPSCSDAVSHVTAEFEEPKYLVAHRAWHRYVEKLHVKLGNCKGHKLVVAAAVECKLAFKDLTQRRHFAFSSTALNVEQLNYKQIQQIEHNAAWTHNNYLTYCSNYTCHLRI